mgnify:CR=1 FL=1
MRGDGGDDWGWYVEDDADRPGTGPKLPGAPDTTARTWAARAAPGARMANPRSALQPVFYIYRYETSMRQILIQN